jgi:membrane protease YdiL (CAAX protease family)
MVTQNFTKKVEKTDDAIKSTVSIRAGEIQPLPFWKALLYFGIPALGFRIAIYNGIPWLLKLGLSRFDAAIVSMTVPCVVLFGLAFGFYKHEGWPLTLVGIQSRFRLGRMTGMDWLWTVSGFITAFLMTGALGGTSMTLIRAFPAIRPPESFPAFVNPLVTSNLLALPGALAEATGAPLEGNWGVVLSLSILLFFNIIGEELWWRGIILPRQELVNGRWTWLVNGLLWLLFHMPFYPWRVIDLLPYTLIIAFVAQHRKNTWPAIIIHCQNAMVLVVVLAMVLGMV